MSSSELPDRLFETISQDTIELVRNDDNTYFVDFEGYNQITGKWEPLDLTGRTEILMTARNVRTLVQEFQATETGGEIVVDDVLNGKITISLANAITNLSDEIYNYDIEVQWGTIKRTPVIGRIKVAKDVTYS